MGNKIPVRFFIVTFLWTWFFWLVPLVLTEIGIVSENNQLWSNFNLLFKVIGIFGPAIGAFFSLYTINGKGSIKNHLKLFISLKFG